MKFLGETNKGFFVTSIKPFLDIFFFLFLGLAGYGGVVDDLMGCGMLWVDYSMDNNMMPCSSN